MVTKNRLLKKLNKLYDDHVDSTGEPPEVIEITKEEFKVFKRFFKGMPRTVGMAGKKVDEYRFEDVPVEVIDAEADM